MLTEQYWRVHEIRIPRYATRLNVYTIYFPLCTPLAYTNNIVYQLRPEVMSPYA